MTLFKYKSTDHIEDVIINKRLWCSRYDALNDPMEWAFTSDNDKKDIEDLINDTDKERWRICCLSKSEQYGLMWSMYGDEHRGVCIEVEIDVNNDEYSQYTESNGNKWWYGDINYTSKAQQIESLGKDIKQVLWYKSKQWVHEQEVRFVKKLTNEIDDNYMYVKINTIYLGRRMDKDRARNIKMLCDAFDVKYIDLSELEIEHRVNYWNNYKDEPFKK